LKLEFSARKAGIQEQLTPMPIMMAIPIKNPFPRSGVVEVAVFRFFTINIRLFFHPGFRSSYAVLESSFFSSSS